MARTRRWLRRLLEVTGTLSSIHWLYWLYGAAAGLISGIPIAAVPVTLPVVLASMSTVTFITAVVLDRRVRHRVRQPAQLDKRTTTSAPTRPASSPPVERWDQLPHWEAEGVAPLRSRLQKLLREGVELRQGCLSGLHVLGAFVGPITQEADVSNWEFEVAQELRSRPLMLARFETTVRPLYGLMASTTFLDASARRLDHRLQRLEEIIKELP
jgi:hypothetical protein